MKKFNTILAIAAVALTSVFGLSSCEKEESLNVYNGPDICCPGNPVVEETKSLNSAIVYDFSADALSMVDVSYVVTDYEGHVDSIAITQPGKGSKKIGSTSNLDATANVKVIVTPKEGLIDDMKTCNVAFYFEVKNCMSSNINPIVPIAVNNPSNLINCNYGLTKLYPLQFANKVAGTYEITLTK